MLLEQTLHLIVDKARHIRNSVEDALLNVTVEAADLTALAPSPTPNYTTSKFRHLAQTFEATDQTSSIFTVTHNYNTQFSSAKFGTLLNSRKLLDTNMRPWLMA